MIKARIDNRQYLRYPLIKIITPVYGNSKLHTTFYIDDDVKGKVSAFKIFTKNTEHTLLFLSITNELMTRFIAFYH